MPYMLGAATDNVPSPKSPRPPHRCTGNGTCTVRRRLTCHDRYMPGVRDSPYVSRPTPSAHAPSTFRHTHEPNG
ncbi:hypothetical protein OEIGOIKO_07525 [Streptomyces chrestomyceticus JCM 4735]|uniref:Uncharacterized protein n=1 Tax=Streptomyces chrestomyceticus JCM 4735 TaxID=1306181 RepID=A0A7U9Q4Q0_9ACTN|nr:hypothetical protein OEIGOIKO_07525 [Streptomyces chrestomyceticus JCM 4735]